MYTRISNTSIVTAILPEAYMASVLESLKNADHDVMRWHARGTLRDRRWYRKLFPAISPEKGVVRVLVPNTEIDSVMQIVIDEGKLHRQGTGAVYCVPCEELHIGGHFHTSCLDKAVTNMDANSATVLKENLDVIHCIVEEDQTEQMAKAAIAAGGHGPIIHFAEGRGLRDRLGWLRITKKGQKEVFTVIVENSQAEGIFNAMANAGKLDLPGRGFMYQMPVHKGLFNLPSHYDSHKHDANMQQIISAIDHLMGDSHWRDQTVFNLGNNGKSAGLEFLHASRSESMQEAKVCLTALVSREHVEQTMDMMLDSGAPGLHVSYCQYLAADNDYMHDGVNLASEYGIINCIIDDDIAHQILDQVKIQTEQHEIANLCLYLQPVPRLMTYSHHSSPERRRSANQRATHS